MKFSIAFQTSGDTIEFDTVNDDMAEFIQWYIEQLNIKNVNNFISQQRQYITDTAIALHDTITDVNSFIVPFLDKKFDTKDTLEEYADSSFLNKLHADWVLRAALIYNKEIKTTQYADSEHQAMIDQINQAEIEDVDNLIPVNELLFYFNLLDRYSQLNLKLHDFEWNFLKIRYMSDPEVLIINPYSTDLITNHYANFSIPFAHLGRSLYDKFIMGDLDLVESDENNFESLFAGKVVIGMCPPQTIPLSIEYIDWCSKMGRKATGDNIAIGNLINYKENHIQVRQLLYRNLNDEFLIIIS